MMASGKKAQAQTQGHLAVIAEAMRNDKGLAEALRAVGPRAFEVAAGLMSAAKLTPEQALGVMMASPQLLQVDAGVQSANGTERKPARTPAVPKNLEFEVNGTVLTITIDLSQRAGPSNSGKIIIIGTTSGIRRLPGGESVNVNITEKTGRAMASTSRASLERESNVSMRSRGTTLTLTVDLERDLGMSKSGKMTLIASTKGWARIDIGGGQQASLSLTAWKKPTQEAQA